MFYEFHNVQRETWKYTYTGEELLEAAHTCYTRYRSAELAARDNLAALLRDSAVSQSDQRIAPARQAIETNGKQAEACLVFLTEFARTPEREFHLSLGDVVFFGLTRPAPEVQVGVSNT